MSDRPTPRPGGESPGAEIEVTPEMIEAGVEEYSLFSFGDRGTWVVSAIYRAMETARRKKP
jgi:hypothetical protein